MVVSRSDTKRRKKEDVAMVATVPEGSPKRAKVHAQRKFAQGSASLSSPSLTPVKDKTKPTEVIVPPKYIPSNRPKTEDFLTFLCFRGTSTLPPRLDFFNVATLQDSLDEEPSPSPVLEPAARESPRNSRVVAAAATAGAATGRRHRSNESTRVEPLAVSRPGPAKRNADRIADSKQKPDKAVQALMKKYQDQRLAKQRINTLSKLAQKVKGKNMVRTRSSGNYEEMVTIEPQPAASTKKDTPKKKGVVVTKSRSQHIKRLLSHAKSRRGGLRSGGQLPAINFAGLSMERSRRHSIPKTPPKQAAKDKSPKATSKPFISSLSDFSSDDDQPLLKKPRMFDRSVGQKSRAVPQRGRNVAQKVKNRYAKQRPNKRLKPQIMTRSQLQLKALKDARDKERKETVAKERELKKLKEKEAKELENNLNKKVQVEKKRIKEAQTIDIKKAEKLERDDKELKKRERKETERIAKELKEKQIEKETREKAKRAEELKEESERKEKEQILKQLKVEKEKEAKAKEEREKLLAAKKASKVKDLCAEMLRKERELKGGEVPLPIPTPAPAPAPAPAAPAAATAAASVSSRPSRKTKEAAAFYMEMLGKRLVDLGGEDDDDSQSMDSFPELPNAKRSEQREKEIKARAIENNWTPSSNRNKQKSGSASKLKSNNKEFPRNAKNANKRPSIVSGSDAATDSPEQFDDRTAANNSTPVSKSTPSSLKCDQGRDAVCPSGIFRSTSLTDVEGGSHVASNAAREYAESFSDSDEEPLGKLAMRSRSNSAVERDKNGSMASTSRPAAKPRRSRDVPLGGMKEALRESITHTPFLPRKTNAKLPAAKGLQSGLSNDAIERRSAVKQYTECPDKKVSVVLDALVQEEANKSTQSPLGQKCVFNSASVLPASNIRLVKEDPCTSKILDTKVKQEQTNIEPASPFFQEQLKKNPEQRSSKGKVNMSTEQIEKWLNDSCNQDTVRLLKPQAISAPVQIPATEEPLRALGKPKDVAAVRVAKPHQLKAKPQGEKTTAAKGQPQPVPKLSTRVRRETTTCIQSHSSAFKKSLHRAIEESIKDNADFIRRNSADTKVASVASKEVSPISDLSISTVGLSVTGLGDSPGFRLLSGRSAEDLRDVRHLASARLQPDRTPEKKSIFQRGQPSAHKARQRNDPKPNADAFSPENESSVYAFETEPEVPPMSKPFRRRPTRDSRASSVATSRSEDDSSKLVDEEISMITQSYKFPQATDRNIQHTVAVASTPDEHLYKATGNDEFGSSVGRSYLQSRVPRSPAISSAPVECLPQLRDDELSSLAHSDLLSDVPIVDLNTSNTTSNSDEDLSAVRDRLLRQQRRIQPPTNLTLSSSASIAVQVNLDTEDEESSPVDEASFFNQQSLECSTQTEEDDDDANGHLFYIPLQPGAAGAHVTASGMIQGVAVKLGTEGPTGPNQRVIMRAKLVTKPPTYNRAVGANSQENRSLLGQQAPRRPITALPPDQKPSVCMSASSKGTYPPVGTVQPTARSLPTSVVQVNAVQLDDAAMQRNIVVQNVVQHANIHVKANVVPSAVAQKTGAMKPSSANPLPKSQSCSVNLAAQRKSAMLYSNAHTAASNMFALAQAKHGSAAAAAQQKAQQDGAGARPGTVKWALPHSVNAARRESKSFYYSQTPDKVLVAKKEAFISAVPPLAPLSYAAKKPPVAVATTAAAKPPAKSAGPSQVQSSVGGAAMEARRVAVNEATNPPSKLVPEKTAALSAVATNVVDGQSLPGPSAPPPKPYTGAKRGPKFQVKKTPIITDECCRTKVADFPSPGAPSQMVEAPTFYPTEEEFQDPIEFIDRIRPMAEKYGLCRIVPPKKFKPECKVSDDMRFTAYNQYVHKTLHRWGPNVKEMMAIRKYLATQNIVLKQPPYIGSIEIDLPRLYQTVQALGGLKEVILKARWQRVADDMKISKSAQDRATKLDDIYCKYLLPYETLSTEERTKLLQDVEASWNEREIKAATCRASVTKPDDDSLDEEEDEIDECIVKGRSMALNQFYRTARNTMHMWFKQAEPPAAEVETEFWRHVTSRQSHVCVHAGSIESSRWGYGFPVSKNSPLAKHSWNLKVLTNNSGSVLRSMGPIMGVTVPTIHVGMLFTTCCWYRDPHGLPWVEYLHTGANKIWYGIPDECSSRFRSALCSLVPRYVQPGKTVWLPSDTAMVPPAQLVEAGVSLCRVVQQPGQFVVVYPRAFTSSICAGYLVSESVYFAQPAWLDTAEQAFKDIQGSCEPSMFSLERLLFSIAADARSSVQVLKQVLPMIQRVQTAELDLRSQLAALGLKATDRLRLPEVAAKKRKSAADEDGDYECEVCRANLYVSLVTNSHEEGVYCLTHAIDLLTRQRQQLKYCKLLYMYNQAEMNGLVDKLRERIELKSQKKLHGKPSLNAPCPK